MRAAFALLVFVAIFLGGGYFVVATEPGTQWLLARAEPYLPTPLNLGRVSGTWLSGIEVEHLAWRDDTVIVEIDRLSVVAALRPLLRRHVAIDTLDVDGVSIEVLASSTEPDDKPLAIEIPLRISTKAMHVDGVRLQTPGFTRRIDTVDLVGSMSGSSVDVSELAVRSDWLRLDAVGDAGLIAPYPVSTSLSWWIDGLTPTTLAGELQLKGDNAEYNVIHALSLPSSVETDGTLQLEDGVWVGDLANRWEALTWNLDDGRRVTSPRGILRVTGHPQEYAVTGDAAIQFDTWPDLDVVVDGLGSADHFEVASVSAQSSLADLHANGNVSWKNEPQWNANFEVDGLQLAELRPELSGSVNAVGSASGSLPANQPPQLQLQIDKLSGTVNDHPVDGAFVLSALGPAVDVTSAWVAVRANRIEASGRVGERVNLSIKWNAPALDQLLVGATGQSSGSLRVQGSAASWQLSGRGTGTDLSWGDYGVGSVSLEGNLVTAGQSNALVEVESLRVSNVNVESANLQITGLADAHTIDVNLRQDTTQVSVLATGGYAEGRWLGQVQSLGIVDGDRYQWSNAAAAELLVSQAAISLETLCLVEASTAGQFCATAGYEKNGTTRVESTLEAFPLAKLPLQLASDTLDVEGSVAAEAILEWRDQTLNGSAEVRLIDAAFNTNYEGGSPAMQLERADAVVNVVNNKLSADAELTLPSGDGAKAEFGVTNVTNQSSAISGVAMIELTDLSFLPLLIPAISSTQGRVSGNVTVGGTVADPELGGDVRLTGGSFRANAAGIVVSDISVQARQSTAGQLVLSGEARSGEGNIAIDGNSRLDSENGLVATVSVTGENFEFIRLPDWQAVASPEITLTIENRSAHVRGKILVPQASVTLASVPETAERSSEDAVVHGEEVVEQKTVQRFDIDVQATLGDSVQFSGFGLDTHLAGKLRVRGGSQDPYIGTGRIELREGRYKAYGQELDIERGTLLFTGPLADPTLDVRASRQIGTVVAGLNLSGTPSALRSTVFSEPPLSDAEALSYLIAGRPLATTNNEQGQRVGQAAFALGLTGAEEVITQIQTKLGLDSLSLGSGDDVGRIVAGRRIGGRLMVEYGYGLVDQLGTLLLRYQLNSRLIVETTTGSTSTVDIVYSVKKD